MSQEKLQTPTQHYEGSLWQGTDRKPVLDIMNELGVEPGETFLLTIRSGFRNEKIDSQFLFTKESERSFSGSIFHLDLSNQ